MFEGISEELKNKIINSLSEELKAELKDYKFVVNNNGEWLPKSKLSEIIEQKNNLKKTIEELQKSLKEAEKTTNIEVKTQLEELTKKFTADIEAKEQEFNQYKTKNLAIETLRKHNASFPDLLLNKLDLTKINTIEDQIKELKNSDYKTLFKEVKIESGTEPPKPGLNIPMNSNLEVLQGKKNKNFNDFASLLSTIKKE